MNFPRKLQIFENATRRTTAVLKVESTQ